VTIDLPQDMPKEAIGVLVEKIAGTEELTTLVSDAFIQKKFKGTNVPESADPIEGNYYESCEQLQQRTVAACSAGTPLDSPFVARLQLVSDGLSNNAVIRPQFIPANTMEGVIYGGSYIFVAKDSASFSRVLNAAYTIASNYQMNTGITLLVQYESTSVVTAVDYVQNVSALVMAVIILTIVIGGLNIFVSVTGGIFERKRTFVRLRILGADTSTLVRALLIEIIVPLVGLSVVVVGLGVFCCYYILSTGEAFSKGQLSFSVPGISFWVGACAAIVLCSVVSLMNIPLLNKLTSFDDMRSE
jgi:ABC-type antimicrobial peptide transport system permease subunit